MSASPAVSSLPPVQSGLPAQSVARKDADGDSDGTKAAAPKPADLPLATSGSVGTKVNKLA